MAMYAYFLGVKEKRRKKNINEIFHLSGILFRRRIYLVYIACANSVRKTRRCEFFLKFFIILHYRIALLKMDFAIFIEEYTRSQQPFLSPPY